MGLTFTTEEQKDLTLPEDSIHRAKLLEINQKTITWTRDGEAKSANILEWWWEITKTQLGDDYLGRKVKGTCDARLSNHPNNQFHNWAETLLGRQIPPGMGIDTDDLIGLQAEISIRHRPDKKDPAKIWEEVDEVMSADGDFAMRDDDPPF